MYAFIRSAQLKYVNHKGKRGARVRIWSGTLWCPRVDAAAQNEGYRAQGLDARGQDGVFLQPPHVMEQIKIKGFLSIYGKGLTRGSRSSEVS